MANEKHKVFISYHHANDQWAKEHLLGLNFLHDIFIDASVTIGDIPDDLADDAIRRKIRDEYLKDSTVSILLVGTETKHRKHIDWELYSSMYDGAVNKKSGILVIELPSVTRGNIYAAHPGEQYLYSGLNWEHVETKSQICDRHPFLPERILDNLGNDDAFISVVPWDHIEVNSYKLSKLIDVTFQHRTNASYDLSRPMRRNNFNPKSQQSISDALLNVLNSPSPRKLTIEEILNAALKPQRPKNPSLDDLLNYYLNMSSR